LFRGLRIVIVLRIERSSKFSGGLNMSDRFDESPDDERRPPPFKLRQPMSMPSFSGPLLGLFALTFAIFALFIFIWFFCRIEPRGGQIAVLIHKTGRDIPAEQVLALEPKQKGIKLDVLAEGRYFRNPYSWGWEIHPITDIPAGKLGVVTRLYGTDLASGKILAETGTKGIVPEVLTPGKYRINPYASKVEQFDAIRIRPGHVGVKTLLVGNDVLNNDLPANQRNMFLVAEGLKGVIAGVLDPGTYYLNPYVVNVVEVNLQSQRFEMSGDDVISFLTLDGFTVTVEGTIEFGLERDKAALLTHRVGDMDDIIKKVILPRARGFSRIEGSKHPAVDFIVGETRQKFQSELENHLKTKSENWGVEIKSVLIRKIIVPDEIASISRDREVAVQEANKYEQQIEQARSRAELVKQQTLALQNAEKVKADTARIQAIISAQQGLSVDLIAASQRLGVAKVDLQAAGFQSQAILAEARGKGDAIRAGNTAEASVVGSLVTAFGGGINLARYELYKTIGPKIETILSSDQDNQLGGLFGPMLPKGVK
jgi:regulator of protease activity HflC (stomatin/prohibitin superfamily)